MLQDKIIFQNILVKNNFKKKDLYISEIWFFID